MVGTVRDGVLNDNEEVIEGRKIVPWTARPTSMCGYSAGRRSRSMEGEVSFERG